MLPPNEKAALKLFDPDTYTDPYPHYAPLQKESPILWCAPYKTWIFTGYQDVRALLATDAFSSKSPGLKQIPPDAPRTIAEKRWWLKHFFGYTLSSLDPPQHSQLRSTLNLGFNHRTLKSLQPYIQSIANELIDKLAGAHSADIIADFAFPLPALVVARLIGVPEEDFKLLKKWATNLVRYRVRASYEDTATEILFQTVCEMQHYLQQLIRCPHRRSQSDLLGVCLRHHLDEETIVSTCVTLLVAGHETTTNLIGNGLYALLQRPSQYHALREDLSLLPKAIEEFLRFDPPVQLTGRIAKQEIVLKDVVIHPGQQATFFLGAANRDPTQFADPNILNIQRHPNVHLAFGHGIHYCIGGKLARLEGKIAFTALLKRLPKLRIADAPFQWAENVGFRGLKALPVSFQTVLSV